MNENYKVYMHRFPNGKVYIGITRVAPKERWRNGKGYSENRFMQFAINKYGWENVDHIILFSGLSQKEAELKEVELIAKYNSTDQNFGYNIENGGNVVGKTSETARKHIGEAVLKYHAEHPEYRKRLSAAHKGKKLPQEQKDKIGAAHKGKKRSNQAKENMSAAQQKARKEHPEMWDKAVEKRRKAVLQLDKEGNILKQWESSGIAAEAIGIAKSAIVNCCTGRSKTAAGYRWEYVDKRKAEKNIGISVQ